jgi:RNA polymerase sigma factor (sigma-70 family)
MPHSQRHLVFRYLRRVAGAAGTGDVTDADLLARFVTRRDEAAFELLLWRHGTMVLHICRDVTRDAHAAEDAFQATFLALVRKAGSIRAGESLGAWLYQVAYRVALKARSQIARRNEHETAGVNVAGLPAVAELPDEASLRELRPVLHEEVQRLPAKYRTPIVLCYLQGLTHEEAARQLGWPKGTVAERLARARELLRKRLSRRGVALSVALSALALAPATASAVVPASLVQAALRTGLQIAAGQALAGLVSPQVVALTEGVIRTMCWNKMKLTAAVVLALGLAGGGVGLLAGGRPGGQAAEGQEPTAAGQDEAAPKRKIRGKDEGAADAKGLAARAQSRLNLKNIALAMHNYLDVHGAFPTSAIYGKNGKPLLSWRVALLPYLDQGNLYKQFHLDEPWDSPHNKKLLEYKVKVYHVPGHDDWTRTYYQVFVGEDTIFERRKGGGGGAGGLGGGAGGSAPAEGATGGGGGAGGPPGATGGAAAGPPGAVGGGDGRAGMRIPDITDGTSNTLLVVEGATPVPWTKPEDLAYAPTGKLPALGGAFKDVIHAAFADGTVFALKKKFNESAMRAAITRNGGEVYDRDDLIDPAPGAERDELKLENERLRKEVDDALAQVRQLQEAVRKTRAGLNKEGGEADTVEDQLKQEQQRLRRELERLEQEVKRLRDELNGLKPAVKRKAPESAPER